MSAKKKSARVAEKSAPVMPREIISTCQIKTGAGTPVTWTAFRRVEAPVSAPPDCYYCTLPDNTGDLTPSEYDLFGIAAQARGFTVTLTVADRDVVYFVTPPGGTPQRTPISRGDEFIVPARGTGTDLTKVTLTFDGDCCTIEAVPNRPGSTSVTESPAMAPMDGDSEPPPPLPSQP